MALPDLAPVPRLRDPNEVILGAGGPSRAHTLPAAAPVPSAPPKQNGGMPPLPPGFKLDAAKPANNVPPLPPGFKLDARPATPAAAPPGGSFLPEVGKSVAAGAVGTTGTALKGLAGQNAALLQERIDGAKARLAIMDAIDRGEVIPTQSIGQQDDLNTAEVYRTLPEAQRKEFRASQQRVLDTAVQPDLAGSPLFKAGQATTDLSKDKFKAAKDYENSWTRAIGEGFGSTLPFMAAGMIPGGGTAAGMMAGSALSAGSQIEDAIAHGATKEQVIQAVKLGGVPGLTEQLPIEVLFNKVPLPKMGKFATVLGKVLANIAAEGGQEGVQQAMQNLIARYQYNPDQDISEGVLLSAAIGGIVGGGASVTEQAAEKVFGAGEAAAPSPVPAPAETPAVPAQDAVAQHPPLPDGFTLDQPTPDAGAPSRAAPAAPVSADEAVSPPPVARSPASNIPAPARAILRASHVSDDEIDAMSEEEAIAEVARARQAGVVPTPEQIQAATEYAAPAQPAGPPASAEAPAGVPVPPTVDQAAHEAATSPLNDRAEPTPAQKEAGNYKKGHYRIGGLPISIENPQGSVRTSKPGAATPWEQEMQSHYGYIKGTVGKDKDHIDVFIKRGTPSDITNDAPVFVVDQVGADGKFDEHKVMIGYDSQDEADAAYHANYAPGWTGRGAISQTRLGALKQWLDSGNTKKPWMPKATFVGGRKAPTPKGPRDIIQFLALGGGVQDFKGELQAIDAHKAFVPGVGKLVRTKGRSLDTAREAAAEAGYFDHLYPDRETAVEKSTIRDLLDTIAETNRGSRQYSSTDTAEAGARADAGQAGEDQARADSAKAELADASDLPVDHPLVDRAAMIMLAEGVDAGEALERAALQTDIETDAVTPDTPPYDDPFFDEANHVNEVQPGAAPQGSAPQRAPGELGQGSGAQDGAQGVGQEPPGGSAGGAQAVGPEPDVGGAVESQPVGQPAPVDQFDAAFNAALNEVAPQPISEPGAEGKPQAVIPGAERITRKQEAQRAAEKPMRGKVPQKDVGGLFSDEANQTDLVDMLRKPATAGAAAASAVKNTGLALADVASGLSELFGGKGAKLSSGLSFDEETYKKARPLFKAGIAHFAAAGRDVAEMVKHLVRYLAQNGMDRAAIENMRPYVRRFIEEQDYIERGSVVDRLADRFLDTTAEPFPTINQARKWLADEGWKAANPEVANKEAEEVIEHAIVLAAKTIVSDKTTPEAKYDALVALYQRQPRLASRTSTSVAEQAYSTPVPLAYVASRLAGITNKTTVLEPTAGNGALLLGTNPLHATVNELNDVRADALVEQGYRVSRKDAATENLRHAGYPVDVVIANPPFGAVREGGESKVFDVDGFRTTAIDHAISMNALKAMKDDGHAVLIVGSTKEGTDETRSDGYNTQQKRKFYKRLYDNYNVVDHFTVKGDLYARQGAGWPVDVIVIDGRGKSSLSLPAVRLPRMIASWSELKGYVNADAGSRGLPNQGGAQVPRPSPSVSEPGVRGAASSQSPGRAGSPGGATSTGSEPGTSGIQPDRGQSEPLLDLAPGPVERPLAGSGNTRGANLTTPAQPRNARVASGPNTAGQIPYRPYSREGVSLNTLVPAALDASMDASLARLEAKHGDIDHYVADALGYDLAELKDVFGAEQIDALALAIDNVAKGDAFVLGDQTGIGKGRVVAGAIRFAHKRGMLPMFVTEKPDLYGDMYRDINDIKWAKALGREPVIFMTNANTVVPLDEAAVNWISDRDDAKLAGLPQPPRRGKFTASQSPQDAETRMREILSGKFKPDVIFTSYDQQNSKEGEETVRRRFMDQVTPRSFLIMDESHNAGGQGPEAAKRAKKDKAPPRSAKFREWVNQAKSVMYSSATYAKNPQVMDLYSRTDMAKAVAEPKDLPDLIVNGGVPLQQIVASMLAEAGQYARRERSFEGIEYALDVVAVDQQSYADFAASIASIFKFDRSISEFRKDWIDSYIKEQGAGLGMDSGIGEIAANSTEFASIMHNIVNQMLLAIKADSAAEAAIKALERNEKPVIALALTSESFLSDYADDAGIKVGQPIDIDFRDVVRRYLERTLRITVRHADDTKEHIYIPPEELGSAESYYHAAMEQVNALDLAGMPVSPIDWIRHRIREAGYTVREVTGRQNIIHYGKETRTPLAGGEGEVIKPAGMTLAHRGSEERGPGGKRVTVQKFNDGALDVVIINASGSTGISMHSKASFKDRRRRHMMIVQANGNPDTHMQTLGRINRTGQVNLPAYTQLAADIPAEARPIAVLMKKMASLSANTTASRKSSFSAENAVDFMNQYGDLAAMHWANDNPDLHADLGWPIRFDSKGKVTTPNPIQRLTGRLMLLSPDDQQDMIDQLTISYKDIVEQKTALGENALEARALDLQAEPVSQAEIKPATGASPFQGAANLETMRVKSPGRAMKPNDVVAAVAKALELPHMDTTRPFAQRMHVLEGDGKEHANKLVRDMQTAFAAYKPPIIKDAEKAAAQRKALNATMQHWREVMARGPIGSMVTISSADRADAPAIPAIVVDVKRDSRRGNPVAGAFWKMTFAIADQSREITMPFSQINLSADDGASGIVLVNRQFTDNYANIEKLFDAASREGKEERLIATGNLLSAFDQLSGKGQIIQFTDVNGNVKPGILMPRDYSVEQFERERRVRLVTPGHVMAFLDQAQTKEVVTTNDLVTVCKTGGSYEFEVDKARAKGGKYYTDTAVRAVFDNWTAQAGYMRATVQADKATALIAAMQSIGARFVSPDEHVLATTIVHGKAAATKLAQSSVQDRAKPFGKRGAVRKARDTRLTTRIHEIVREIAGKDPQMIQDEMVQEAPEWGQGPIRAAGYYDFVEDVIGVSLIDAEHTTAFHEAFHRLQVRFLTKAERQVLAGSTERLREMIVEHGGRTAEQVARMAPIEVEAEAFALWSLMRERGNPAGLRMHIGLRRAWERLRLIAERVRNMLHGMGYKTAEDVFAQARSGEILARGEGPSLARGGQLLYQWIDTIRHVRNATVMFDDAWQARFFELGRQLMAANGISKSQALAQEYDDVKTGGHKDEFEAVYNRMEQYLIGPERDLVRTFPKTEEPRRRMTRQQFAEAAIEAAAGTMDASEGKTGDVEATSVIEPDAQQDWARSLTREQNPRPETRLHQAAPTNQRVPAVPPRQITGALTTIRMSTALTAGVRMLKGMSPRDRRTAADGETAGDYLQRKWTDYLHPLLKMQEEGGHSLTELNDAYLNARIAEDSALAQMEGLNEKYAVPMVDALAAGGASLEDFHNYSVALHAEERNRVVGERNEPGSDFHKAITDTSIAGASGISTDQANATISAFRQDPAKFRALRIAHGHLRAMFDANLKESRRRGLISDETYNLLTTQWRNYVPLKGNEGQDEQGFWKPGLSGFDVRGAEFKTAMGRFTEAENVIAHAITQTQQSILRQHKNEVGKALLRFINEFDPEGESIAQVFWAGKDGLGDIAKAEQVFRRKIGKDGKVTWYRVPNPFANRDDVLAAKIGGKSYYIRFADPKVGLALRKMGMNELGLLPRIVRPITVWQSIVNTRANPAFTPINIVRDLQAGAVHLLDEGFSAAQVAGVVKNIPTAIRALWRLSRGKTAGNAEWEAHAKEYIAHGGKITFHGYSDLEGNLKKLERQITRAAGNQTPLRKTGDIWNAITKFVGDLNDAGENGIRLASYVAARTQQGRSAKEAAFMARDLTVDFKKHGEFGPAMNSFYVFFNAAIQGNINIGRRLVRSRKVQAAVAGFIFAGMMEHFWNSLMAGDDDDGENAYKKLLRAEGWRFERQLVFFIPGTKRYVSFPMPYGYNAFHFLGVQGAAMMDGSKSPTDGLLDVLRVGFDAFNPVGSGSLLSTITPTIGDPIVDIATNENFFGGPLVPDENPFDASPPPQSTQSFNSTHPAFKMAAEALNSMTGGDSIEPGAVDVYPDTLEHLWGYLTGGIGRFAASATDATASAVQGDIEPKKVPWVKSFYGEVDEQTTRNDYFRRRERIEWVMGKLKERQEEGNTAKIESFIQKYQPEIDAGGAFKAAEKQRRSINKQRRKLEDTDMPSAERNAALDELDKQEIEAMRAAREAIVKAEQP